MNGKVYDLGNPNVITMTKDKWETLAAMGEVGAYARSWWQGDGFAIFNAAGTATLYFVESDVIEALVEKELINVTDVETSHIYLAITDAGRAALKQYRQED